MTGKTARLGLIGAGRWGARYISTIAAMDGVELAVIASDNPETPRLAPSGCKVVRSWQAPLEEDLDGLIIASPSKTQAALALAAINRGMPVLLQKPLALDVAGAEAIHELAMKKDCLVVVDQTQIFNPGYQELKRIARQITGPMRIRSAGGAWGPFGRSTPVLWDWGPHDLAMCLDLAGTAPESCRAARKTEITDDGYHGELISIHLSFGAAGAADITIGNIMPGKTRILEVAQEGRTLVFDDINSPKLTLRRAGKKEEIPFGATPPLTRVVEHFARAILERDQPRDTSSLELALDVVRALGRLDAAMAEEKE